MRRWRDMPQSGTKRCEDDDTVATREAMIPAVVALLIGANAVVLLMHLEGTVWFWPAAVAMVGAQAAGALLTRHHLRPTEIEDYGDE
jgi:uncharacterized integral membrane protein